MPSKLACSGVMDKFLVSDEDTLKEVALLTADVDNLSKQLSSIDTHGTRINGKTRRVIQRHPGLRPEGQAKDVCISLLQQAGYDLENPTCDLEAALLWAVDQRNLTAVKTLINHRASVHVRGASGLSALHLASKSWNSDIMRLLLAHGARADVVDRKLRNSLHVAIMRPKVDSENACCLPELDSITVSPHTQTDKPKNSNSTRWNQLESVARVLFQHKIPINSRDQDGRTALWYAIDQGYENLARLLIVEFGADTSDPSLLHVAAVKGYLATARLLIAHDANPDAQTTSGESPLYLAAVHSHAEVAELFLSRMFGVKATITPPESKPVEVTVLHKALYHGKDEAFRLLLKLGADNILESVESTLFDPLECIFEVASKQKQRNPSLRVLSVGQVRIIEMLTQHRRRWRRLAQKLLCKAIRLEFHLDAISLVRAGIYPTARLRVKPTLVQKIQTDGPQPRQRTQPDSTILHLATWIGNPAVVQALLDHGARASEEDEHLDTPLFVAVAYSRGAILSLLLERGADINHVNDEGQTPLHVAAKINDASSAALLLQNGPVLDVPDRLGYTALHTAVLHNSRSVIESLLEYGSDPNLKAHDGKSSIELSKSNKLPEITQLLRGKTNNGRRAFWKRESKAQSKELAPHSRYRGPPPGLASSGQIHEVHGDSHIPQLHGQDSHFEMPGEDSEVRAHHELP